MTPTLQLELRGGRRWLWAAFAAHLLALAVFVVLGKLELTVVVLQLVAAVLSLVGVWLLTDTFNTPPIGRLVSLAASVVAAAVCSWTFVRPSHRSIGPAFTSTSCIRP